jgi:hypothetical protein
MATKRADLAAWAGMVGPALFVLVFTVEGWLRPGYHPLGMYVSALSTGPRGWIQILNFVIYGLLALVFARGVAQGFQTGRASRSGPALLTIIAISYLVSGPFVTDPAGIPRSAMTGHGLVHGIFGAIVFSLMPVCCFVFGRRFGDDPQLRPIQPWTYAAGTIIAAAVALLTATTKVPGTLPACEAWVGLIQRTAIIPYMAWQFAFALRMYRRDVAKSGQVDLGR